jgi:hypothetical protein
MLRLTRFVLEVQPYLLLLAEVAQVERFTGTAVQAHVRLEVRISLEVERH